MTIRVLVVDDSGFFRRRIRSMIEAHPQLEVCGEAPDGQQAVEMVERLKPDVVTMDIEMPVLDGISAVREINRRHPTPVLMFSSLTYDGAKATLDALEAGAVDFIPKRFADISGDMDQVQRQLTGRLVEIGGGGSAHGGAGRRASEAATGARSGVRAGGAREAPADGRTERRPSTGTPPARTSSSRADTRAPAPPGRPAPPSREPRAEPEAESPARERRRKGPRVSDLDLVVIGCSTGGPVALQRVLTQLPHGFPLPVLVIQHMPASFTPAFAERLNDLCQVGVREAQDGDSLRAGEVLLAPGGQQLGVRGSRGRFTVYTFEGEPSQFYKPSVDIAFTEAAGVAPGRVLGIVLTGMGADGAKGARVVKDGGGWIWSQDEETSVIYGMPAAVAKAGVTDLVLPLDEVGRELAALR